MVPNVYTGTFQKINVNQKISLRKIVPYGNRVTNRNGSGSFTGVSMINFMITCLIM